MGEAAAGGGEKTQAAWAPGPPRAPGCEAGGTPVCPAELTSQKVRTGEEAQGLTSGSRNWGGREADCAVGARAPRATEHEERMEKQVKGGGEREK